MQKKIPIIDNAFGIDTNRAEAEFARDISRRICARLSADGIKYHLLVPELIDISIMERVRRANRVSDETEGDCFIISIHSNASKDRSEIYATKSCKTSRMIAETLAECCKYQIDGANVFTAISNGEETQTLSILGKARCAAVVSNLHNVMKDKISDEQKDQIAEYHFNAIKHIVRW